MGWLKLGGLALRLLEKLAGAWRRHRERREVSRRHRRLKEHRHAIDQDPAAAGRRLFGRVRRGGGAGEGDG